MTYRSNPIGREPPTPTDDVNKGYGIGSRWTDKIHNRKYTCTDATNRAAIWIEDYADVTDPASVGDAGAVMDSDFLKEDGFMLKTGEGTYEAIKSNMEASAAPATSDDSDSGYAIGSRWLDTTSGEEYVCLDATAEAAVWVETTASYTDAEAVAAIAAADVYLKRDGSKILTSDWDIGDTRKILADEIRARDGAGLKLHDDAGMGLFVEDGGYVGIGTTNPTRQLDIYHPSDDVHFRVQTSAQKTVGVVFGNASCSWSQKISAANHYVIRDIWNAGDRLVIDTTGKFGISCVPTALFDINSDILRLRTAKTPATSGSPGNQGDHAWDAGYFYICVATNTWERTPHAWDINVYDDAAVTKLAGIETGATKYPDTGEQAFLDGDHTKLNGIEAAADVTDSTNVTAAGAVMQSIIKVGAPSEVTLSDAGVAAITSSHHTIDSYGDAATDTMTGISGGVADQILILRPESSARTITIDSGFLNIALDGGADFVMDHANDQIMLLRLHDSDDWIEISRSNNGT